MVLASLYKLLAIPDISGLSFNFLKLFDSTPNLLNKSLKLLVSLIKSYELSPNLYKILL